MREYFSALFLSSLLGAVCTSLAGGRLEKYMRYLASLLCLLVIISPLRSLEFSSPSLPEGTLSVPQGETLSDLAQTEAEKEICAAISASIAQGTGITPASLRIDIDWEASQPTIHAIAVTLRQEDFSSSETVVRWAEDAYGVPCHVTEDEESS